MLGICFEIFTVVSTIYNLIIYILLFSFYHFQIIFVFSLLSHEQMLGTEYTYPEWSLQVGYILTASSIMCIPIYIIYKFAITPGNLLQVTTNRKQPKSQFTVSHLK